MKFEIEVRKPDWKPLEAVLPPGRCAVYVVSVIMLCICKNEP